MIFDPNFINEYNGVGVDVDGYYGPQCMDLMHLYIADCLGLPTMLFSADTAYNAFVNANDPRFDKIINNYNDPNQIPSKGDIMFWKPNIKGITGSAGHVAIFKDGKLGENKFTSLDQNFPTGSVTHLQSHTYDGVAGWLH